MVNFASHQERLQQEKAQLKEDLDQLGTKTQPFAERREGSPFGKKEEEATEVTEMETRIALEERLLKRLAEVEHALQKFEAGTYGLCDHCGQPIEPARLEILPHASLCISCKANQTRDAKGKTAR